MSFELPVLPYSEQALEPYISKETLFYHHGKHHRAYVQKLNLLIKGTSFEEASLEEILLQSEGPIFNNAAQVWNHTFYWNCLTPESRHNKPQGLLVDSVEKSFGSFERLKREFTQMALGHFGSGWAWLVKDKEDKLSICTTSNAENPIRLGYKPLLTCDLWEHAYYLDTQNDRGTYLERFWVIANWFYAQENFSQDF